MMGFSEKEIEERLPALLEFADIGAYVYPPVTTYSSGMFVRLAFAVAINIDPEILIVDEALSVGDVFFQAKCYHKFEEFKQAGKTIVFVSHDLSSIAKYCDRVFLVNKGELLGEGSAKEMIDAYKQVLVGQYGTANPQDTASAVDNINPNLLEYGTKQAEIVEYFVTDERGVRTTTLLKGTEFTIHMKVKFNEHIPAPIMAFSFKTVRGTEITGTNTMLEKAFAESGEAGECKEVTFTQRMSLQGGEYLLSFGLTGYNGPVFEVYHRLYDSLNLTVVSEKDTVGYYDMDSEVRITDI
jgi:teichoic acid transport system ATP-binding protein